MIYNNAPQATVRHLDGAERSVGSPRRQERMGSDSVPRVGPRRLGVWQSTRFLETSGLKEGSDGPSGEGSGSRRVRGGETGQEWYLPAGLGAGPSCWASGLKVQENAQPENPRTEPHWLECVRRGARAEPGLSVSVAAGSWVCVSLRRGVCVLHTGTALPQSHRQSQPGIRARHPSSTVAHPVPLGPLCPAGEAPPLLRSQARARKATDHRLPGGPRRRGVGCRPMSARGRG